jgi:hypothetical protein
MTLCEPHGRLRCGECAYVEELQERIQSLQQQVNTLTEALERIVALAVNGRHETYESEIAIAALQSIKESPREERT